jgi:hypothetical protein
MLVLSTSIDLASLPWKGSVLATRRRQCNKQDSVLSFKSKLNFLKFAVAILNLVDSVGFEPTCSYERIYSPPPSASRSTVHYYLNTLRHGSFTPRRFHNVYIKTNCIISPAWTTNARSCDTVCFNIRSHYVLLHSITDCYHLVSN